MIAKLITSDIGEKVLQIEYGMFDKDKKVTLPFVVGDDNLLQFKISSECLEDIVRLINSNGF